jgi:hypothetical protein
MVILFDAEGQVRQSFAGALKKEDFLSVLKQIESDVRKDLAQRLPPKPRETSAAARTPVPVTTDTYRQLQQGLMNYLDEHLDTIHGGLGTGDKHPYPQLLAYLLDRYKVTKDGRLLIAVEKSLEGILRGIFDGVEGGFFRYAQGREWRQPHYEKMAHLNASLARVFQEAHRITRNKRYRDAADATIAYILRTFYDTQAGGFFGSQSADPSYYRLPPEERKKARKPPVNRDKAAAWNAEIVLAFVSLSQASGRKELKDAAIRSLEFLHQHLLTEKGVYHMYEANTGRGYLRGQLQANAWSAKAFLEGYRVYGQARYREAAEKILGYLAAELFDHKLGAFIEEKNVDTPKTEQIAREILLDTNGVAADAFILANKLMGRSEYLDIGRRVLGTLGGEVKTLVLDGAEAAKVADVVFYFRAYERVVK